MSETVKRAISGVIYIVLLVGTTVYSPLSFEILFGIFMLIASYEFAKLIKLPAFLCILLSLVASSAVFWNRDIFPIKIIAVFAVIILLALTAELFFTKEGNHSFLIKLGIFAGYILASFITILYLPFSESNYEPNIVISIFILIWTNDTFAYIIGKKWGKNKLFERISPKKTIEGFAGGILFCILASIILSLFFNFFSLGIWISSAIFVGVFGTIGDLIESKFKREANVKDSGNIMPGHGGILDRLDSIIFVAPFLYIIFQIL